METPPPGPSESLDKKKSEGSEPLDEFSRRYRLSSAINLTPNEERQLRLTMMRELSRHREHLEGLSIPKPDAFQRCENILKARYEREWRSLMGDDDSPYRPVFLIPTSRRVELGAADDHTGFFDRFSESVVVFFDESASKQRTELAAARTLAHELAHAYGRVYQEREVIRNEDGVAVLGRYLSSGLGISTGPISGRKAGGIFEEYYAVTRQLEAEEEIRKRYPAWYFCIQLLVFRSDSTPVHTW